jgi:Na+-driven multidrug efflux pump
MSLSMAVTTIAGQNIGAGHVARAKRATIQGAAAGCAILTLAGLVVYVAAPAVARFFVPHDPEVIARASHFLRIMCLSWGGIGVQLCVAAAFRASGNMLAAMTIALVSRWAFQLPLAYVLSRYTDLHNAGLWWSFPVTNVAIAILSACWFAQGGWRKN